MKNKNNKPKTFEEAIDEIFAEQKKIMIKKQFDYGHDNILAFGELGCLVKANDKIARLKNLLLKKKKPENESMENSWQDLLNYALISLMLRKGTFELPLQYKGEDKN